MRYIFYKDNVLWRNLSEMPFVAVNLSQAVLSGIKELIDEGKYASLESFVEVASFNQLALERSGGARLEDGRRAATRAPRVGEQKAVDGAPQRKRSTIGKVERQIYLLDRHDKAEDVEAVLAPFRRMVSTPR